MTILACPAHPYEGNRTVDLLAGFYRVFQQVPQQGAYLRFAYGKLLRYIQFNVIVNLILACFSA